MTVPERLIAHLKEAFQLMEVGLVRSDLPKGKLRKANKIFNTIHWAHGEARALFHSKQPECPSSNFRSNQPEPDWELALGIVDEAYHRVADVRELLTAEVVNEHIIEEIRHTVTEWHGLLDAAIEAHNQQDLPHPALGQDFKATSITPSVIPKKTTSPETQRVGDADKEHIKALRARAKLAGYKLLKDSRAPWQTKDDPGYRLEPINDDEGAYSNTALSMVPYHLDIIEGKMYMQMRTLCGMTEPFEEQNKKTRDEALAKNPDAQPIRWETG